MGNTGVDLTKSKNREGEKWMKFIGSNPVETPDKF